MVEVLLFKEDKKTSDDIVSDAKDEEQQQPESWLFCRYCGHRIAPAAAAVEMNGSHHHTFFNPAGIVYQIRCFSSAAGCIVTGDASSEFTWFAGFSWRIALCSACLAHMGWFFSSGENGFYGLISTKLSS
jgi:hypothetical protein